MNKPFLRAGGVHKSYLMGRFSLKVLKGVDLTVREGEILAVTGASGSGKSTLLHILGALDVPTSGEVCFGGQNLFALSHAARDRLRNRVFGFVFQFYHLLPELDVLENTLMPRMIGSSVLGYLAHRREARRQTCELLERMGLGGRLKHKPAELSGGERQRVAMARALCNRPRVLLADEPTGTLDSVTGAGILEILTELNRTGQTIVLVTHDPDVARCAHRVVHLADGRLEAEPVSPTGVSRVARAL